MEPPVPDVGTGVAVSSTSYRDFQAVPPGEIDSNRHILGGGGHHDDVGPTDAGLVVDRPESLEPRPAAGHHLAYHQGVEQRHRGLRESELWQQI